MLDKGGGVFHNNFLVQNSENINSKGTVAGKNPTYRFVPVKKPAKIETSGDLI